MTLSLLDCDVHFNDHDADVWEVDTVPVRVRPRVVEARDGSRLIAIGDLLFPRPTGPGRGNPSGIGHLIAAGDRHDRHRAAAANGALASILQPGFVGLSIQAVDDHDARRALLDHYNVLVSAEAAKDDDARWVLLTTLEDLTYSSRTLHRFADDPKLVGVVARPTGRVPDVRWSDDAVLSVLDLLAQRDLTLFLHGGTGCYQWSPLADHFESYAITHAFGHMGEHMVAVGELLGVIPNLPADLRIVLLESGTSWLPPVLDRLESHRRRLGGSSTTVWDTFSHHVAVVPDLEEVDVAGTCARIGADNVLFGSDFPHWDCVAATEFFGRLAPVVDRGSVVRATARFVPRLNTTGGSVG